VDQVTDIEPAATPLPALAVHERPTVDPYEVYLGSLKSPESRRTMRGALDRIAKMQTGKTDATGAWQPWWLLRYENTIAIRAALISYRDDKHPNGYAPSHVNKHLIALRRVLRVCWRMKLMSGDDYERARDIESLDVHRLPSGRNIHREELASMLGVCAEEEGPAGARDAALIAVLYSTGMRRSEASSALLERYDAGERTLRIIGKRDKEREVYISPSAVPILTRWLSLLGTRRGPMFRPIHKTGKIADGAMTPRAVGYIVDRVRRKAGLAPLATHDFRRTHTGDLLDAGVDLATAQRLLGHASATTTASYDRRPSRAARAAADRLTLPSPESLRDAEPGRTET
jgi:site-specific recombinase XerD